MKWKRIVPLTHNYICPLFILSKGHSQLSVTEDVKGGPYIYWLYVQGDYFVVQSSLTRCFITFYDVLASGLIYL